MLLRRSFKSLLIAASLASMAPAPLSAEERKADFTPLAERVESWVESGAYPGAGLLIGRGDEILYERYFGSYDARSVVHVASAGKWVAVATIASVVDSGQLHWNDPVSKWLPKIKGPKGRATLRQLLSHVAAYPDYQPADQPEDHYQTLAESIEHIIPLPADGEPGSHFRYGGLAMQVAGRMAELATGEDWEHLFQSRIAAPLGMTDTGFTPVSPEQGFSPTLAGGLRTTLRDYAHFLEMIQGDGLFRGHRILSRKAIAEMQRDQVGGARVLPGEYVDQARAEDRTSIYGLGEWRDEVDAHGRATLISSAGWAGAYPWLDKATGTYGFLLAKVDVPRAKALEFSSFLSSPVLPLLARDALADAAIPNAERGYAAVQDGTLYWEASGHGPPMILLHGHSFDRTMWDPQMAELEKHFRVIRYDMRGYGRSSMPHEGENILHAEDLRALMDALGIAKAHLVGLSLGGAVAVDMLALHPDRLLSVTAASGDIFDFYPAPSEPWTEAAIAARHREIAALRADGIHQFKRGWLDQLTSRGGTCVRAIRPKLWAMISKWTAWQPLHLEPRLLLGRAAEGMLRQHPPEVPLQILTGDADVDRPDPLLAILPDTPRVVIPNAGHVSNLEDPGAFAEAVIRFAETGVPANAAEMNRAAGACPSYFPLH